MPRRRLGSRRSPIWITRGFCGRAAIVVLSRSGQPRAGSWRSAAASAAGGRLASRSTQHRRGSGLGRRLAAAARHLVPGRPAALGADRAGKRGQHARLSGRRLPPGRSGGVAGRAMISGCGRSRMRPGPEGSDVHSDGITFTGGRPGAAGSSGALSHRSVTTQQSPMLAISLAAVSALVWGTADFSGGKAARRGGALAVTVVSQILGLPLVLCFVLVLPGRLHAGRSRLGRLRRRRRSRGHRAALPGPRLGRHGRRRTHHGGHRPPLYR